MPSFLSLTSRSLTRQTPRIGTATERSRRACLGNKPSAVVVGILLWELLFQRRWRHKATAMARSLVVPHSCCFHSGAAGIIGIPRLLLRRAALDLNMSTIVIGECFGFPPCRTAGHSWRGKCRPGLDDWPAFNVRNADPAGTDGLTIADLSCYQRRRPVLQSSQQRCRDVCVNREKSNQQDSVARHALRPSMDMEDKLAPYYTRVQGKAARRKTKARLKEDVISVRLSRHWAANL